MKNNMLIKFVFSRFAEDSCEHSMPPASVYRFTMHLRYKASFTGFKRNWRFLGLFTKIYSRFEHAH